MPSGGIAAVAAAAGSSSSGASPRAIRAAMESDFFFGALAAAISSSDLSQSGLLEAEAELVLEAEAFLTRAGREDVCVMDGGGVTAFAQDGTLEAAAISPFGSSLAAARIRSVISRARSISSSLVSFFFGSFFFEKPISTSVAEYGFFGAALAVSSAAAAAIASAASSTVPAFAAFVAEVSIRESRSDAICPFGFVLPSAVTLESFGFSKNE